MLETDVSGEYERAIRDYAREKAQPLGVKERLSSASRVDGSGCRRPVGEEHAPLGDGESARAGAGVKESFSRSRIGQEDAGRVCQGHTNDDGMEKAANPSVRESAVLSQMAGRGGGECECKGSTAPILVEKAASGSCCAVTVI